MQTGRPQERKAFNPSVAHVSPEQFKIQRQDPQNRTPRPAAVLNQKHCLRLVPSSFPSLSLSLWSVLEPSAAFIVFLHTFSWNVSGNQSSLQRRTVITGSSVAAPNRPAPTGVALQQVLSY